MRGLDQLCGLREPSDLVRTFVNARGLEHGAHAAAGDHAGTGEAGLSSTRPAPKRPDHGRRGSSSCRIGTVDHALARAVSPALRMASAISLALPRPTPTRPLPSPTATIALKLKRRPPLTTLATRLMLITFSIMSDAAIASGVAPRRRRAAVATAAGTATADQDRRGRRGRDRRDRRRDRQGRQVRQVRAARAGRRVHRH